MSTAASAREAIRAHPFLLTALRAGILNYSAAARHLGLDDVEAGAAALRRFAREEEAPTPSDPDLRIRIEREIPSHLRAPDASAREQRALVARGELDELAVARIVARLYEAGVESHGLACADDRLTIVVDSSDSASAIRCVEGAAGSTD